MKVVTLFSTILISVVFFSHNTILARYNPKNNIRPELTNYSRGTPQRAVFNINNISSWQYNNGKSGNDPDGNSGIIYPRGTAGVVFQDGIIWGGLINNTIFVGGQTYRVGTQSGRILPGGVGEDPNLPHVRIYKIRDDYLNLTGAQLIQEAAEFFQVSMGEVTGAMTDTLLSWYARDWNEWPVDSGAPFYDLNGNGIYEPNLGEKPGLQNADMVIWFVCNDLDSSLTHNLYGSDPIGLELQVTIWGYDLSGSPLGQGLIRRYRLINKSATQIDSMYISQWVDADLGNFSDDLVGCDSLLSMAFAFNSNDVDAAFDEFGLSPPAIGYSILQGPIKPGIAGQDLNHNNIDDAFDFAIFNFDTIGPGYINLPATSFGYNASGNSWLDPIIGSYDGTLMWYNMLRGFLATTDVMNPIPFTHRLDPAGNGPITKWPLNGDPLQPWSPTNDVDGAGPGNFSPSDRRMHLNSGPFVMAPGDTQEVIVAVYGGIGNDRLQSFANMKQNIENIKNLFGTPILIPGTSSYIQHPSQSTTELFVQADLRGFSNVVSCETNFIPESGSEPGFSLPLLDDGMHNDSLAGDGIWGNSIVQSNRKVPYNGGMVITTTSNQFDFPGIYSKVRLRPLPKLFNWRVTWENGRQDSSLNNNERIYLSFDLQNQDLLNDIDELEIINLQPSAYITNLEYNDVIPAGGIATNERFFLELIGPSQGDSLDYSYIVIIDGHRGEILSSKYPVVTWNPNPIWGDTLQVQSIVGTPDNVTPIVADPLLVNGHTYRIHFFEDTGTGEVLWRLIDYTTGSVKLDSLEMVTGPGFPHPVVDGIQWQVIVPPSTIKDWQYTSGIPSPLYPGYNDGRWFTGVNWGGGALSGGLGMSHIFWGAPPGVAPADFKTVEFRFTPITGYDDLDGNGEYTLGWGPNGEGEPYYFDTSQGQKAFMYHTWNTGTANYVGFHDIPFQVWDVEDPANPRQLNVVVRDRDQNTRWDIWHDDLPYNYVWVLADDYDPTGQAWDPANGPDHDFFAFLLSPTGASPSYYVLWAQQRGSRPFLAESGELTLTPYKHNGPGDILEVVSPPSLGIEDQTTPVTFYLQQNYPNPFNPETRIRFGVARKEKVALVIYNVLGQQVKKLVEREMSPGNHEIIWDGRNDAGNRVGSGIYFYRLIVGDQSPGAGKRFVQSRKMILLK